VAPTAAQTAATTSQACPPSAQATSQTRVGFVKAVLRDSVFVDKQYAASPPLDVRHGSTVCTDATGETVLVLGDPGATATTCVLLRTTTVTAFPRSRITLASGTAWCSLARNATVAVDATTRGTVIGMTTTPTTVGIALDSNGHAQIKVWRGAVKAVGRTQPAILKAGYTSYDFSDPRRDVRLSADERVAILKLMRSI
jgi:hypothetical protein